MCKDKKEETIEDLRKRYHNALKGLCYDNASVAEVNAAVEHLLATDGGTPTPREYVDTIESLQVLCRRCAGTGQFVTMVLNGRPTGPGGICFRCEGKGSQDYNDGHRNRVYDLHALDKAVF